MGLKVFVHKPTIKTRYRWLVVVNIVDSLSCKYKGSATSSNPIEAYIKAVAELGESLICSSLNFGNRSGIAAGLLTSQAIVRAKSELIERDAFLYHYRNAIPFTAVKEIDDNDGLLAFQMQSAEKNYYSYLVTDVKCSTGASECLLFGTGCHPSEKIAIEKAVQEYVSIALNHELKPEWCNGNSNEQLQHKSLTDRHHFASRDFRNIERFRLLCLVREPAGPRPNVGDDWKITRLSSPLRFFNFVYVQNESLISMTFGEFERIEGDLLHPFW